MNGMKIVPYDGYRDAKIPCVTPRVIELGDVSGRFCCNGLDA